MPEFSLQYLGGATVEADGVPVRLRTGRTAALLAYLAVTGRPQARASLTGFLWDDDSGRAARGNLRVLLSNLRRDVGPLVDIGRQQVELAPPPVASVDVREFEEAAGEAIAVSRQHGQAGPGLLRRALDLYRGEFLEGFEVSATASFEVWVTAERARLRTLACEVLDHLVDAAVDSPDLGDPVGLARRLLSLDELREASAVRLVRAVAATDGRVAALRELQRYEDLLSRELGTGPGPELAAVGTELRARRRDPRPAPVAATEPPAPPRRLVGRRDELRTLRSLVSSGERLVSVVGPGGVGKTTVAAELVRGLDDAGVPTIFVDLTSLPDAALLAWKLVAETGVVSVDGELPEASLLRGLARRTCVLVLDNVEHLVASAGLIGRIVAACPGVTVVVTSRVRLRLAAERVFELSPLALPEGDRPTEVMAADSVRLLMQRATATGMRIGDDPESLTAVAQLCRVLDGLPLAIELAAARLRMVEPAELVRLLAAGDDRRRLALLGQGPRDVAPRHRSLTDALDWSYQLLSEPAQALLRAVGVFEGSFDLEAARAVAGLGVDDDVVPLVSELVDASLVRPERGAPAGPRFSLLMVVRTFARSTLSEHGELPEVERRLVEHVVATARQARDGLASPEERLWSARMTEELPNIRAGLDASAMSDEQALEVLCDLGPFWMTRTERHEAIDRLRHRIGRSGDGDLLVHSEARLWVCCLEHEAHGADRDEIVSSVDGALDALERCTDPTTELRHRWLVGRLLTIVADLERAATFTTETLTAAERAGDDWWWVETAYQQVMLEQLHGDDDAATELLRAVIPRAEALGSRTIRLHAWVLAIMLGRDSEIGEAPPTLEQLLEEAADLGDHRYRVWILVSLGTGAVLSDRLDEAAERFSAALEESDRHGYGLGLGFAVMGAVAVACFRGEPDLALELHGAIEEHLPALRLAMPRTFYEHYAALVAELEGVAADDPAALGRLDAGRRAGREHAVQMAGAYLAPAGTRVPTARQRSPLR